MQAVVGMHAERSCGIRVEDVGSFKTSASKAPGKSGLSIRIDGEPYGKRVSACLQGGNQYSEKYSPPREDIQPICNRKVPRNHLQYRIGRRYDRHFAVLAYDSWNARSMAKVTPVSNLFNSHFESSKD